MEKRTVVLVDDIIPPSEIETSEMRKIGAELSVVPCTTEDEVIEAASVADGIMTVAAPLTRRVIRELQRCRVIARYGTGLDNVDLEAATERGIVVAYAPEYCYEEVATMTVTLLLACARKVNILDSLVKRGEWKRGLSAVEDVHSLAGRTLGLVGFGKIARSVASKMKPFGVRIIAFDPYINEELAEELGVRLVEFEALIREADYISVHVPLTDETRYLFREEQFRRMKPGTVFVNASRGAVVHEPSLYTALKEGWIAAAGLDVMEREPPDPDNPLLSLDNVTITGHLAAATVEAMQRLRLTVATGVSAVLSGFLPSFIANPDVLPRVNLKPYPDERTELP